MDRGGTPRAGLEILCSRACGFESHQGHPVLSAIATKIGESCSRGRWLAADTVAKVAGRAGAVEACGGTSGLALPSVKLP